MALVNSSNVIANGGLIFTDTSTSDAHQREMERRQFETNQQLQSNPLFVINGSEPRIVRNDDICVIGARTTRKVLLLCR